MSNSIIFVKIMISTQIKLSYRIYPLKTKSYVYIVPKLKGYCVHLFFIVNTYMNIYFIYAIFEESLKLKKITTIVEIFLAQHSVHIVLTPPAYLIKNIAAAQKRHSCPLYFAHCQRVRQPWSVGARRFAKEKNYI